MQDNIITAKLLNNGKESSEKGTRHLDTRLFCVKDLIRNDKVKVACCPKERMIADHNTKPLIGGQFKMFRCVILNLSGICYSQAGQQERAAQTLAQMNPCIVTYICCTIVLDDVCLCRDLTRSCMSACLESRAMSHLLIVELFFGWC